MQETKPMMVKERPRPMEETKSMEANRKRPMEETKKIEKTRPMEATRKMVVI